MTIVVGWVPKPEGWNALEHAIAEAELRKQPLLVLNTSSGASYADASWATDAQVESVRERLERSGVRYELRHEMRGRQPSQEVVDAAAESEAVMVVIGLRHRSTVGKFLMGSTAQEILMGVRCPVLAVPAPD